MKTLDILTIGLLVLFGIAAYFNSGIDLNYRIYNNFILYWWVVRQPVNNKTC